MSRLDSLGQYEQSAVRTVERHGFAVVEKAPEAPGCWVVWNYDQSYPQEAVRVFGTEVEALRWALDEQAQHRVTFVPWGHSPRDVVDLARDGCVVVTASHEPPLTLDDLDDGGWVRECGYWHPEGAVVHNAPNCWFRLPSLAAALRPTPVCTCVGGLVCECDYRREQSANKPSTSDSAKLSTDGNDPSVTP